MLACVDIPVFAFCTFKKIEREIGLAAEKVAKNSCLEATMLEKRLTTDEANPVEQL